MNPQFIRIHQGKFLYTSQSHFDTKWFFFYEDNPNVGNEVWTGWSGLWGWDTDTEGNKEKVILVKHS